MKVHLSDQRFRCPILPSVGAFHQPQRIRSVTRAPRMPGRQDSVRSRNPRHPHQVVIGVTDTRRTARGFDGEESGMCTGQHCPIGIDVKPMQMVDLGIQFHAWAVRVGCLGMLLGWRRASGKDQGYKGEYGDHSPTESYIAHRAKFPFSPEMQKPQCVSRTYTSCRPPKVLSAEGARGMRFRRDEGWIQAVGSTSG